MAVAALVAVAVAGCTPRDRIELAAAPPVHRGDCEHAEPIQLAGVPRLFKIDDHLYRSAQPTAEGFANLRKMGIRTVINLRSVHSDRGLIEQSGLNYIHLPMHAWFPDDRKLARFLDIVADREQGPFLVHCWTGSDRTGLVVALYRLAQCGWNRERALDEMTDPRMKVNWIAGRLVGYVRNLEIAVAPTEPSATVQAVEVADQRSPDTPPPPAAIPPARPGPARLDESR